MVLGEAVPRNDSEAVEVEFVIPGQTEAMRMKIRRGFVGTMPAVEVGSQGYEGRQRVSAVFERWEGDTPIFRYRTQPAGPGS